jgi:hypothetical protein
VAWFGLALALGCGSLDPEALPYPSELRINEVVSDNEGVWLDEAGETEDYVELFNASARTLRLSDYLIVNQKEHELPELELLPQQRILLWADDTPAQGPLHLPFKLSSSGEPLKLLRRNGDEVDSVLVPPLEEHHAFSRQPDGVGAFHDCGWATPGRENGASCGPPPPAALPDDLTFAPYRLPLHWPAAPEPLAITEAALRPARLVEVENTSAEAVELGDFELWVAPHRMGTPWPTSSLDAGALGPLLGLPLVAVNQGARLALPEGRLGAGERVVVPVRSGDLTALAADPHFEGVLTVIRKADRSLVDRVDFSSWPDQAVLARAEPSGTFRFCQETTAGAPNEPCTPVAERPIGDHERRLLTPGDFHALALARGGVGVEPVEFLIDMAWGDAIVLLNSANWDLHYSYVREAINGERRLNRCIPEEQLEFSRGWYAFSEDNYFRVEGRRYLLGTFVHHAGTGLQTVEFAAGDTISAAQMKRAFFAALTKVPDPENWSIRPTASDQVQRLRTIEGQLPIVGPNAPFRGITFQSLSPGVAFGTLRFVPVDELRTTPLGPRDIVVTDEVPNDIPLLGGLITEAFQTPLAHVNVLSRGRGTPNMALRAAREDARLTPYFGRLVKLEVTGSDFTIEDAVAEEALAFWESRLPESVLAPRLDTGPRGVQPLEDRSIFDLPSVGGKAAQMAELIKVPMCDDRPAFTPERPFAIPVVHSLEHYSASGALALLEALRQDPAFAADPLVKNRGLERVRALVLGRPVDPKLLAEVKSAIRARFPGQPLRFRSSSNTEDLPGFSGAGLYTSEGVDAEDVASGVEDAIRTVWASLWERRAYDEREFSGVDQTQVAMAVLVHPAYRSERVNGVAISRDALQPTRGDRYYINAQVGEALVTNPAPGIDSEQFTYELYRLPRIVYHSRSSFSPDAPVISEAEASRLSCNLYRIHEHFRPLLDPAQENSWFAMDIEWKLMGDERALVIKQARAYSFGEETPTGWCDF